MPVSLTHKLSTSTLLYYTWNRFVWCKVIGHLQPTDDDWVMLSEESDKLNIPLSDTRPVGFYCRRCTFLTHTLPLGECSIRVKWQVAQMVRVANDRRWP